MKPSSPMTAPRPTWRFSAIGTGWSIETKIRLEDDVRGHISACIEAFDATYSRFRSDSIVTRVAEKAGSYEFPHDSVKLVDIYRKLYDATDGAMTPLVGDSLSAYGYDMQYTLKARTPRDVPVWDETMRWEQATVTVTRPTIIDFGAIGKGYLIDKIAAILDKDGIKEFIIDASGDILQRGMATQVIGLENPYDPTMVIGTMELRDASLCASATNRRKWGTGLHHVIDGRSSKPTDEFVATWVVADSATVADGLATALFFVGPDKLHEWQFTYVRLHSDGHIEHSPHFVGELFA